MSLINREALYEKACDLEAQALAYVGKIANDETKIEEWKIWSAILVERTAFKHDIFDAPSVQQDIIYCKDCKHKGTKNCVANAWTTIFGVTVKDDFYCGLAERRTDG